MGLALRPPRYAEKVETGRGFPPRRDSCTRPLTTQNLAAGCSHAGCGTHDKSLFSEMERTAAKAQTETT